MVMESKVEFNDIHVVVLGGGGFAYLPTQIFGNNDPETRNQIGVA